jgi:D12 class N6 adenine-specific DNA methyltransferase
VKAPFPWFGGKRRVAGLVWPRFGDVPNYVDPFCGSLGVPLERPHEPRCETINDVDCYLANFWRATIADPEQVVFYADWPVNEADLHARHQWLVDQPAFRERMKTDPMFYDCRIAGWWVWGLSQWIGGGWCSLRSAECGARSAELGEDYGPHRKLPKLRRGGSFAEVRDDAERGAALWRKRPNLRRGGLGINGVGHRSTSSTKSTPRVERRRPNLKGNGVHRQLPDISGADGAYGRGVHAVGLARSGGLLDYFLALRERLRHVRVCCGDWRRVLGHSPTDAVGITGVFLDPPYSELANRKANIYAQDDLAIAHDVREWAIAHGHNRKLRIALCGYEGEHKMPPDWRVVSWTAPGGYANQRADSPGRANKTRERIWFSPHCLVPTTQTVLL